MTVESGGSVIAYQPATGGTGLMGVVPRLWQTVANQYGGDLLNPETNLRTAAYVLNSAYLARQDWTQATATFGGALDAAGQPAGRGQAYIDQISAVFAALSFDPASAGGPTVDASAPAPERDRSAADALGWAMTTLGTPYVWGGESYKEGGFDCSGLVLWAYAQVGKTVPRVAADQWRFVERIDANEAVPGDLIFFRDTLGPNTGITHVGFYAGDGLMLHAPKENDAVRVVSLNTTYWRSHLAGYGRVP
jgi:cell wall-associated NlpC family hydrolase